MSAFMCQKDNFFETLIDGTEHIFLIGVSFYGQKIALCHALRAAS